MIVSKQDVPGPLARAVDYGDAQRYHVTSFQFISSLALHAFFSAQSLLVPRPFSFLLFFSEVTEVNAS